MRLPNPLSAVRRCGAATVYTLGAGGLAVLGLTALSAALTASSQTLAQQGLTAGDPPKVTVVGASMSAGFRLERYASFFGDLDELAPRLLGREVGEVELAERATSVAPAKLFAAAWGTDVTTHADNMLFMNPARTARKKLTSALADDPDLVVGLDLMFWFGYGDVGGEGPGTAVDRANRIALQQQGLDLLDELLAEAECQLVVGDYPDLSDAVPLMINERMIPSAAVRAELDERLRHWADQRPRVRVFPLAAILTRLRRGEVVVPLGEEEHTVAYDRAMQFARVHPTRLGVAVVAHEFCTWVSAHLDERFRPRTTGWETFLDGAEAREALLGGAFAPSAERGIGKTPR